MFSVSDLRGLASSTREISDLTNIFSIWNKEITKILMIPIITNVIQANATIQPIK